MFKDRVIASLNAKGIADRGEPYQQKEMAAELGMSQTLLNRNLSTGKMNLGAFKKMCDWLGVSADWLLN